MRQNSYLGKLLNFLEYIVAAIGSASYFFLQFLFISIVLADYAGIIYAVMFGKETVLLILTICSVALIVLPTLIQIWDRRGPKTTGDPILIASVLHMGAEYEGLIGKFTFVLKYGLIPTNVVGLWLIS